MRILLTCLALVLLGSFTTSTLIAQTYQNWCGQVMKQQQYRIEHPEHLPAILAAENQLRLDALALENNRGARAKKVIPVVFHVIHQNGIENISDAQVFDQMRILNEDYNKANADLVDIVSSFTSIIGDIGIEFRLAQLDPQGNPTNGIDRIVSSKTNSGDDPAKLNPWPRASYLNIWVVKKWANSIPSAVLAYAYLASDMHNSPTIDGIIIRSQYVGSIGTSSPTYSRTLTHEIGHYLNLEHTWGATNSPGDMVNCNYDDGISDTPKCIGNYACNTSYKSCGTLDNIQNHMDYSNCSLMFTQGQGTAMLATLNSATSQRNNLSTPSNLTLTGVDQLTIVDFGVSAISVCQYESIDFSDKSQYDVTAWNWTFTGANINSSTASNPTVYYEQPGIYDVSLEATNPTNTISTSKLGYIMVNPMLGKFAPFSENFNDVTALNHEDWYAANHYNDEYGFEADAVNGLSGGRCLRVENYGNELLSKDELRSTTYDLRLFSSVTFTFDMSYAQKTSSDLSKLTVYISNDCGQTWSPRWSAYGPLLGTTSPQTGYFIPNHVSQWETVSLVNLPGSLFGQTSQFKFVFENKSGNNLYIDNVTVNGNYTDQAQLKYPLPGMASVPNNQTLFWKAMGGGVEAYEYQLDTDQNFNSAQIITGTKQYIDIYDGLDTEFNPGALTNGQTYFWRVRLIKNGQGLTWSDTWSFTVAANGLSIQDQLNQQFQFKIFPNPTKGQALLSFSLMGRNKVSLSVTNLMGQTYVIKNTEVYDAGQHVFNLSELQLSSGLYIFNLEIGSHILRQKLVVQ